VVNRVAFMVLESEVSVDVPTAEEPRAVINVRFVDMLRSPDASRLFTR
jgi:hypothetical protein